MERLKENFPMLGICINTNSLYACESFFKECGDRKWHYILRFKEGSIPTVASEYKKLKKVEKNYRETTVKEGKISVTSTLRASASFPAETTDTSL